MIRTVFLFSVNGNVFDITNGYIVQVCLFPRIVAVKNTITPIESGYHNYDKISKNSL